MRMRLAIALAGGALTLSACAYDTYGDPYGYGPYGGVSLGYYGGGYGPYGYGYGYAPYGYGYGSYGYGAYDPFGWYGDYYYPGVGIYVYDRGRNRHVWNDTQRRYWTVRAGNWQGRSGTTRVRENWSGFSRNRENTMPGRRHHSD